MLSRYESEFTQQPQQVVYAVETPLKPSSLLLPTGGNFFVDVISGLTSALAMGSPQTDMVRGNALKFPGGVAINQRRACQGQKFSRLAVIMPTSAGTGSNTISISTTDSSGGGAGAQWFVVPGTGIQGLNRAGQVALGSAASGIANGKISVIGVTYDGSQVKFYADGRLVGSNSSTSTFIINASARLGSRDGTLESFTGNIMLHADWENALPEAVMMVLTANPWQVFRPEESYIWVPDAAGGNPAVYDTCSGSDAISIAVAFGLTDTGAGDDLQPAPGAALTLLDDGASTDAVSLAALLAVTDSGTGNDQTTVSVAFALADSGSAADAIQSLAQLLVTVNDAASGADAVSVRAQLALSDTGGGSDTPVLNVSLAVADTGSAADALTVLQQLLVQVADIASGSDSLTVGAGLTVGDAGAGLEGMAVAVAVPLGDAGSGTDAPSIRAWLALVEQATGMDATVAFDSATRIATILFKLAHRAMTFTLASRQISFTLN